MRKKHNGVIYLAGFSLIFSSIPVQTAWSAPKPVAATTEPAEKNTSDINDYPYYPRFFNETISKIYGFAESGDYIKASQVLTEKNADGIIAMEFGKADFLNGKHSDSIISRIESIEEQIKAQLKEYVSLQGQISSAVDGFMAASKKSGAAPSEEETEKLLSTLNRLVDIKAALGRQTAELNQIFNSLKETREVQDASFISYLIKFVAGTGRTENTGIAGALTFQWLDIEKRVCENLFNSASVYTKKIAAELSQRQLLEYNDSYGSLSKETASLKSIIPVILKITDLEESFGTGSGKRTDFKSTAKFLQQLTERTDEIIPFMSEIADHIHQVDDFIDKSVADTAQDLRDNLDEVSQFYIDKSNIFADYVNKTEALIHSQWILDAKKNSNETGLWTEMLDTYMTTCEYISKTCNTKSGETTLSAGTRLISAAKQMYVEDTEKYQALMSLIPEASEEDSRQYPTKLLNSINTFRQSMALDITTMTNCSKLLGTGSFSQSSNIQYMQRKIKESIDNIQKLSSQTDSLVQQAQAQQKEAMQAQSQIDIYYNRARAAFNSGDFTTARNNLDRASSLYTSLIDNLKRDVSIQDETYNKISTLKQSIAEKQQPLLVQEVRVLKNNAKNAYYAGNFDEASQQITLADETIQNWSRFMDMEVEKDEELERLKNLINTALAIKSGKELNPNDALYPEMSQILSISNQYYQQGQNLIGSGKTADGKALLSKAKDKLNELKIVYPRNQQANLLSMRIDQILDLKQFNETFKTRVDELKRVNYANRDLMAQESYSDLQDLYELSPNYPGLADFKYQVELTMGLKQKNIDAPANDESQAIARKAQQTLASAGRDPMALEAARKLANQALAINSSNDLALSVLDEVALRTGSQAAVVLSAADEAKYQQAITYLQNGNVIAANSNLQEILKKPANRRSAKVQKLQSRIKGMLN